MKDQRILATSKVELMQKLVAAIREWDWSRTMMLVISIADRKSARQRGYQFGWVYPAIVQHLNMSGIEIEMPDGTMRPWDVDILHEFLKREVLAPLMLEIGEAPWVYVDGKEVATKALTTEGRMDRFSEYILRVKAYVHSRWECVVPEPLDDYYESIEQELRRAGRIRQIVA